MYTVLKKFFNNILHYILIRAVFYLNFILKNISLKCIVKCDSWYNAVIAAENCQKKGVVFILEFKDFIATEIILENL